MSEAREARALQEILDDLRSVLALLRTQTKAVRGHFALAQITTRNLETGVQTTMATNLVDDQISNVPVIYDNIAGQPVAAPSGGSPSVTLDNAAAGTIVVGADKMSMDFSPAQPAVDGAAFTATWVDTLTDGTTITIKGDFVVSTDDVATSGTFNTSGITRRPLGT